MILYDFQCTICKTTFEELIDKDDPLPKCPICEQETEMLIFCNKPTAKDCPRQAEIMRKGKEIRNKLTGKTPWRRNSESQSS
jgi:putative FmdB family regulatory protein